MNREQKKERRRELRIRAKEREIEKAEELEEEADSEFDVIETGNEPEPVEKDMYPEVAYDPQPAPISFDELDEMRTAKEAAETAMEATCDTEMLVRNILYNSAMDPTQKVAAINAVTNEFARRVVSKIRNIAKQIGIVSEAKRRSNSIIIEKDASGHFRWVGWVSNNFIDWDGDIISEDAHKEYVDWLEKNMDVAPVFASWHTPGTARKSPVDCAMYENGFLIMSGALEEEEAAGLLKAQSKVDLGMSHGTFVLERDEKDPRIITKYRMYEASDLPLARAANPFTDFETMVKEVSMDKKEYLAQILGSEEKAEAFLEKTGLKAKALADAGVESKEKVDPKVKTEVTTEVKTEVVPELTADVKTIEIKVPVITTAVEEKPEDVVAKVMKEMDIEGLNAFVLQAKEDHDKIPVLEGLIKELQGSQDEKLAEVLTPPASRFAWSTENSATKSKDNLVSEEEIKKAKPGVPEGYWLSDVTNTAPVPVA